VKNAAARVSAASATEQRHKLMAVTLGKRADTFAAKSIADHTKASGYLADAQKMKTLSQADALKTLAAIDASLKPGKAAAVKGPSMETLGANAKVAMNNMNVDESNAHILLAQS